MADVEVSYKGKVIGSLSDSGSLTLETDGKYCEGDIGIEYVKPSGGGTLPLTQFGHYFETIYLTAEATLNHVKVAHRAGGAGQSISLNFGGSLQCPEWFKINAGATVTIEYKNVVNPSGAVWNANFKQANSTTSLSFGIGDEAHLDGAKVTVIPSTDLSIGCLFVFVRLTSGNYIEFDVEITVDGVRYI